MHKIKKAKLKEIIKERTLQDVLKEEDFRVTIFGSARIKKNDKIYKQVKDLAEEIGKNGWDMVTGGGPGLMQAANEGHNIGDAKKSADNIGLTIKLPWEAKPNKHLEIKKHFNKFSDRLDHFMALSNIAIIMSGGIGTTLELFYVWQLIQVKHIHPIPIIVVGKMWEELINWIKKHPLKKGLISPKDCRFIYVARNNKEVMDIILKTHKKWENGIKKGNEKYLL